MPKEISYINRIISAYGSYAKPFLNWILETGRISSAWKTYFLALKLYWKGEYFLALSKLEKALNKCNNSKTLYYLVLTQKLAFLSRVNSKEGVELFHKLKQEFPYIPSYVRNIAVSSLLHYYATIFPSNLPKFRIWSNSYHLDSSSQVFIFLGKAREEIKKENIRKAIFYYVKAFRTSLSIPHPTGIINSLNNLSWNLKERHPKFSLSLAKKAVYYCALYREDLSYDFAVLDTLFEVQRINNDLSICETSMIIKHYYKFLSDSSGNYNKQHYRKTFESSKRFCFDLEPSFYKNNGELRDLNKVSNIKPDFNNLPLEVLIELRRINILKNFQRTIEKLNNVSKDARENLILSSFMSLCDRKSLFPSTYKKIKNILDFSENIKRLINFAKRDFEVIRFLSYISNDHPFFEARMDLAKKFLETLLPEKREFFISFYLSLKEKEKELIDAFVRNYVRYDRDWHIKIPTPAEIVSFVKGFQLKELPSSLAYFCFERRERRNFNKIINEMMVNA
ncbi:hypothetical protein [Dictyoglomus thermophilum]|uniref:Uncharacterized protein n=1 Tax=Dictyoglomus thermophilum (strain ATCC 35947 / DSM 3960 / H-6-12) TaxID=309799 RepID=B5YBY7_DICT6|nr:hypothetical protein [Dictyoglomus thermophilum]ACI19100.1 conserved hypothetical protein [Dictyoglomus thermophilum H-6-12]